MNTEEIKIKVPSGTARMFEKASEEEREKYGLLLSFLVGRASQTREERIKRFKEVAHRAGKQAKAAGLTSRKLEKILNEER